MDSTRRASGSELAVGCPAAARFLRLAAEDISASSSLPAALDDRMPGVLEKRTLLTMTHLWDQRMWKEHRSVWRWKEMITKWPASSVLRAIRLPLCVLVAFTLCVLLLNRAFAAAGVALRLTLPLAPLSLQAATMGLLLVFRNNQTHDRLKEAQRALGSLGALGREIMQLLVVRRRVERGARLP